MRLSFRAMGTRATVCVLGPEELLPQARARIDQLESRWSRFRADSELQRLARAGGRPLLVSLDTVTLVQVMIDAARTTGGRFDPTLTSALISLGYDRDLALITERTTATPPPDAGSRGVARGRILDIIDEIRIGEPDAHPELGAAAEIRLPAGLALDPGGIGKGLAGDLVTAELRAAGADGALVDLGGDVVATGAAPGLDRTWTVSIEDPWRPDRSIARVGVIDGAVTTSSVLRRRWPAIDPTHHHILDPDTQLPTGGSWVAATTVSGRGWWAEVLATVALLDGPAGVEGLLTTGEAALVIDAHGAFTHLDPGGMLRPPLDPPRPQRVEVRS